jgi:ArsR family transcriptional regulator
MKAFVTPFSWGTAKPHFFENQALQVKGAQHKSCLTSMKICATISLVIDMIRKMEKVFKALSDRNRLRIINMLCYKSLCVCEITYILQLSQSTVSGHLRVLKDAELVMDHKDKLWVDYRLNREDRWNNEVVESIKKQAESDSLMDNDVLMVNRVDRNQILCKK